MNSDLERLHPYPFERLAQLMDGAEPPDGLSRIPLSIGEPKHQAPTFALDALNTARAGYSVYPKTAGEHDLKQAIGSWLTRRFKLPEGSVDPGKHVLPVNGTREALFAFTQCGVDRQVAAKPLVAMPNPFYQIYEGAALLAGAEPLYMPNRSDRPGVPDFDAISDDQWQRIQMLFVCSPGNPTGDVLTLDDWKKLFELSDRHNVVLISDECYSELYFDEAHPPLGVLEACHLLGRDGFRNCMGFHSLSKRSSLPGLRSGFVAGDAALIKPFLLYRTYHGCAMSLPVQQASIAAWSDESHVIENRRLYRSKFKTFLDILDGCMNVDQPEAGFYLWAPTPIDECEFTRTLFIDTGITVLPGSFLAREANGSNPGKNRVRMALVADEESCREAATRLRTFMLRFQ